MPGGVPRLEECIYPRCLGFPRWSKGHWEPCCQQCREQVYDRRPLAKKVLDYLLVYGMEYVFRAKGPALGPARSFSA